MSKNIFGLIKKIQKESKDAEDYHTGLVGEKLIVASYKTMPLQKLEALRFILNRIIKRKKEMIRVQNAENEKQNRDRRETEGQDN